LNITRLSVSRRENIFPAFKAGKISKARWQKTIGDYGLHAQFGNDARPVCKAITIDHLKRLLTLCSKIDFADDFEVETWTWEVREPSETAKSLIEEASLEAVAEKLKRKNA